MTRSATGQTRCRSREGWRGCCGAIEGGRCSLALLLKGGAEVKPLPLMGRGWGGVNGGDPRMARYRPPEGSTRRARRLRKEPTEAEQRMWRLLRTCFPNAHFRQQVPIRDFIADFASHQLKIVVEVDGGQHGGADDE